MGYNGKDIKLELDTEKDIFTQQQYEVVKCRYRPVVDEKARFFRRDRDAANRMELAVRRVPVLSGTAVGDQKTESVNSTGMILAVA